jgi:CTP synthase
VQKGAEGYDIALIEVGGTVGDIESQPFLEAVRQLKVESGQDSSLLIHLTLVPYNKTAGETKTKPTQHSVKELLSLGLQPDILICRSDEILDADSRNKIALFTNVNKDAVISLQDVDSVYKIPSIFKNQSLDNYILNQFKMEAPEANLKEWDDVINAQLYPDKTTNIAIVGKYVEFLDAYKSLIEAIKHAGIKLKTKINIKYIDSETIEQNGTSSLENVNAILVPGGFGERGVEGKIQTVKYARENNIPFLGICLGMQVAVIEYARNVAGLEDANSTEFKKDAQSPVISLITEWSENGIIQKRDESSDLGGTMRLGVYNCKLLYDSKISSIYKKEVIQERHRHRFEVNNYFVPKLEAAGLLFSGKSEDETLMEIIELPEHKWFVAVQFHPEFTSNPRDGHPLFQAFIEASLIKNELV